MAADLADLTDPLRNETGLLHWLLKACQQTLHLHDCRIFALGDRTQLELTADRAVESHLQ